MANAREDRGEILKLLPFQLEGEEMLDIRFWKKTKAGPRPTHRGIAIKQTMIVGMIVGLQKVRSQINSEESKKTAGAI